MALIVGLTGRFAAGKGTVAELLVERGFVYHSLSDVIREELVARGLAESRENLLETGNSMRRHGGPAALAERILQRLDDGRDHIVDSIRNPAEVNALQALPGFVLVGVDAEARLRFERLRSRARQGDPETYEHFVELEEREANSADPSTQQLVATRALAQHTVRNDGDLTALAARVRELLVTLGWNAATPA